MVKFVLITPENALACIGARYVSASLHADGHTARMLFLPKAFNDFETPEETAEILHWISEQSPDAVGFSLMSSHLHRVRNLTHAIQHRHSFPIIWGGIHPSCEPESCLEYADAVCVGEGEAVITTLARAIDQGDSFAGIPGLWYRDGHGIVRQPSIGKQTDLDGLPFPDHDMQRHYVLLDGRIQPMSEDAVRRDPYGCNGMHFIMTSRGCPRRCAYCCNETMNATAPGPDLRRRSVENVMDEAMEVLYTYNLISSFAFWDDSFLSCSMAWLTDFCRSYKTRIGLPFCCNIHPDELTPERLELLVDAGLSGIQMGLQTACTRINRTIFNRRASGTEFKQAADLLYQHRDQIKDLHYHVIVDNPWETEEDTAETVQLLTRLGRPFYLNRFSLTFYPGTPLARRALADGIIDDTYDTVYLREYFQHDRTFLNLLMRTTQTIPPGITRFFLRYRNLSAVQYLFYLFYYGVYTPRYRLLHRWVLKRIRTRLEPSLRQSRTARIKLLEAAVKWREY